MGCCQSSEEPGKEPINQPQASKRGGKPGVFKPTGLPPNARRPKKKGSVPSGKSGKEDVKDSINSSYHSRSGGVATGSDAASIISDRSSQVHSNVNSDVEEYDDEQGGEGSHDNAVVGGEVPQEAKPGKKPTLTTTATATTVATTVSTVPPSPASPTSPARRMKPSKMKKAKEITLQQQQPPANTAPTSSLRHVTRANGSGKAEGNTEEGEDEGEDDEEEEEETKGGEGDEESSALIRKRPVPVKRRNVSATSSGLVLPEVLPTKTMHQFFRETKWDSEEIAELKALFEFCDLDGNGKIGKEELREMFKRMNIRTTNREFEQVFGNLDGNGDGTLSFEEFLNGIRWIQKGAMLEKNIDKEKRKRVSLGFYDEYGDGDDDQEAQDTPEIVAIKKKMTIFSQYTGMVVQNAVEVGEKRYEKGDGATAKALVDMIDPVALITVQDLIDASTCQIATSDHLGRLENLAKKVGTGKKK